MPKVLGLDLGTNSIGWSFIDTNDNNHDSDYGTEPEIIDLGVRIFSQVLNEKKRPKNQERRAKRLARRVLARRVQRRKNLQNYLIEQGLLPTELKHSSSPEFELNKLGDPYQLRSDALSRPLEKFELGRALSHLGSRRGFLSTRTLMLKEFYEDPDLREMLQDLENAEIDGNTEVGEVKNKLEAEAAKEEGKIKKAISELSEKMGGQTLGQYLYSLAANERKRNHYTSRYMYQDELKRIFEFQTQFHSELSEQFLEDIENIIFYQRPIRWDKNTIGKCSLEPQLHRTQVARLEFQKFRYWQDLHNLSWQEDEVYIDKEDKISNSFSQLTLEQKHKIAEILERQKSISWSRLKKELNLKECTFNLEKTSKNGLKGNLTACSLRDIYPDWDGLNFQEQEQLVEDLLSYEKITFLKKRLINHWHCTLEQAFALIDFSRNNSSLRASLSLKALKNLLPFMIEGNKSFSEAKQAIGYGIETVNPEPLSELPPPPYIPNPVVQKALYEVRKLVNAIIKTYGKPDRIHIELPRDFVNSKKYKQALKKQNNANQKLNEAAQKAYTSFRENNSHPRLPTLASHYDLTKYRLWVEQEKQCMYSGKMISCTQLFSDEIEIDHILPYSRTMNDSYMNKVVCFKSENRYKGNRTPYEAYSGDLEKYGQICNRALKLPPKNNNTFKKRAFFLDKLDSLDNFINSQLTDTGYISTQVVDYLGQLFAKKTNIIVTRGKVTALLRHIWGLNGILSINKQKNRADHRHHAIDATIIALTNKQLYKNIVAAVKDLPTSEPTRLKNIRLDLPRQDFYDYLHTKVMKIIVSHATSHKIKGALHKETAYGMRGNKQDGYKIVYRKPLDAEFNKEKIEKVVDESLKEFLLRHLQKFSDNPKQAFSQENLPTRHASQGKIRHVRIYGDTYKEESYYVKRTDKKSDKPLAVYTYGSNHHLEIYQSNKTGKYEVEKITMLEAAYRTRVLKKSAISDNDDLERKLIMVLHVGDMVEATQKDNITRIYRIQNISNKIKLVLHIKSEDTGLHSDLDKKVDKLEFEKPIYTTGESLVKNYHMKLIKIDILGKKVSSD